jgi:hypothetical protein
MYYKKLGQALKIIMEYLIYREQLTESIFVCPRNKVKIKYQLTIIIICNFILYCYKVYVTMDKGFYKSTW